ncbi:16S rRNA (cytosine(967)-C(5))-methyltransferase RsmB [Salibacterium halotolerans]|uniref:16S rRNA (cytosine(967)-C(5))-methyltransferase n=1 Tax=Salibacterium halotolerans TaxID=1884432 RepID=A0A1I5M902_9BACI|nr:16S rRNA (cytosine(967)-C(5))-methyltransferase RsmB [Salibacterium halotolerans]SFP05973.1 16S rRNA (cytosine967-C5)-methyltransferase [Salibacterium halotolerans]
MYKNVREEALQLLIRIEKEGAYSHILLQHSLEDNSISGKDAPLLTELVNGTIKRKNTLDFYIEPFIKKGTASLTFWVLELLRLTVYQIVFLDRIPERAAVHEAVQIAKKKGHKGISGLVNGVLRSMLRSGVQDIGAEYTGTKRDVLETSHPGWLLKEWTAAYGRERALDMARTNLEPPVLTIRVNRVKINREELKHRLHEEGCSVEHGNISADALLVQEGNVFHTEAFKEGLFTVQDESSMLPAALLGPSPKMRVLDTCAAPGGKTTHAAEKMNDEGSVYAHDLHEKKIRLITEQADRLGLSSIQASALDARNLCQQYEQQSFDRVLVDAPCSGLGVIRKKPELKWRPQEGLERFPGIQLDILESAAAVMAPGGRLVYSTCTVRAEENEQVVEAFLEKNPDFTIDEQAAENLPAPAAQTLKENSMLTILPQDYQSDGFFMAALRRKASL